MINSLFSWHFCMIFFPCLYLQNSWGNLGTQTTELPAGLVSLFWTTWDLLWSNWLCWKSRFWSHALSGIMDWLKEIYSILRQGIFFLYHVMIKMAAHCDFSSLELLMKVFILLWLKFRLARFYKIIAYVV